jgi:L-iditol 2-dehydrogenase
LVKAVVAGSPGQIAWMEVDEPEVEQGGVLVRPLACGICTTDVKLVRAGYQGGQRYALGHELVGEVVAVGQGARWRVGDRVAATPYLPCGVCTYCQNDQPTLCPRLFEVTLEPGGLSERVGVPKALAERGLFQLPPDVGLPVTALAEPIGCCVQAVETCYVKDGTSVLVVGDGPMGQMNAAVARAYGAQPVIVAGMTTQRLAVAEKHYADAVIDVLSADLPSAVRDLTGGRGADVVIVAVSSAEAVENGLAALRPGGVLNAFAGVPEGTTFPLDLYRLHYEQWHLTGSFGVGPEHVQRALHLLACGQVDAGPLVTATFPFEDAAEAVAYAMDRQGLKAVVVFG